MLLLRRLPSQFSLANQSDFLVKAVHKDRNLDLVGWFTQSARGTPGDNVWPIHNQILEHNESAVLLGFHAGEIGEEAHGGKLPVTIYETNYEVDDTANIANDDGEDKEMRDTDGHLKLTFHQIAFVVETGEAEMISMSGVASGATNAASAQVREKQKETPSAKDKAKQKGIAKQVAKGPEKIDPNTVELSKEEDDMVAAIQTKANAIKMLKSRIDLLIIYLQNDIKGQAGDRPEPSQTLLRLIQALVHRLSLVEPADADEFETELIREENDTETIMLLNELMSRANETRDIGKKFSAIESGKAAVKQNGALQYSSLLRGSSGAGDLML